MGTLPHLHLLLASPSSMQSSQRRLTSSPAFLNDSRSLQRLAFATTSACWLASRATACCSIDSTESPRSPPSREEIPPRPFRAASLSLSSFTSPRRQRADSRPRGLDPCPWDKDSRP